MGSIMLSVINLDHVSVIENNMDFYLKMKPRDCVLYSNDGGKFKIHKEVLGQTKFMRDILKSVKENCCSTLEIICPCGKEDLRELVNFFYDGEIHCNDEFDSIRTLDNLCKIFGFPENLSSACKEINTFETSQFFDVNKTSYNLDKNVQDCIIGSSTAIILPSNEAIVKYHETIQNEVMDIKPFLNDLENFPDEEKGETKSFQQKKNFGKFMCDYCGLAFRYKWIFKLHNCIDQGVIETRPKRILKKSFPKKRKIVKKNIRRKKVMEKHICDICGISFGYKWILRNHINLAHYNQCDDCKLSFSQKEGLKEHIVSNHNVTTALENQEPETKDLSANSRSTSIPIELQEKSVKLAGKPAGKKRGRKSKAEKEQLVIDKSIKAIGMKIPNSVSTSLKEHKCKFCPKSFYFEGSLKTHLGKMHLKSTKPFLCAWCNLRFTDKQSCKEHIETVHRKLKKYKCKKCPKAFFLRGTLKKHLDMDHLTSKSKN